MKWTEDIRLENILPRTMLSHNSVGGWWEEGGGGGGWGEIVLVLQLPHVTVTTLTAPLKARP